MKKIFLLIAVMTGLQACVVEEHYHFNKDLSGTYSMSMEYEAFAGMDSTGAFVEGIQQSMDSIVGVYKEVEGISKVQNNVSETEAEVGFSFEDLDAINRVESMEDEIDAFKRTKEGLIFRTDMSEAMEAMGGDESSVGDDEFMQTMNTMLQIKTIVSFDFDIELLDAQQFTKIGPNTFVYDSKEQGFDGDLYLKVGF